MSFKSIDMSIAVHKNTDAAQYQRELQHKPQADQAALAQSGLKDEAVSRQKAPKLDEADKSRIRDQRKGGGHGGRKENGHSGEQGAAEEQKEAKKPSEPLHPYKGRHIDMSL